jgi:hypothetical protein
MMWRQKKGWKPFSTPKQISTRFRGKWRKQISISRLQQNKDKLYQGTQQSPQEDPERRNSASNQWAGGTKEIPRQQQQKTIRENTKTNKWNQRIHEKKHQIDTENTIES